MQFGSNKTTKCGTNNKPLLYQMLAEIHNEVEANWNNGKPDEMSHISGVDIHDQVQGPRQIRPKFDHQTSRRIMDPW